MVSTLCDPSEIQGAAAAVSWLRNGRRSKTNSKLSLEKALVRRFGLGGQFPDSSTRILRRHDYPRAIVLFQLVVFIVTMPIAGGKLRCTRVI